MKIGIIYYSQTGHTRSVADKLAKALEEAGHEVGTEEIAIKGESPAQPGKFEIVRAPDAAGYDAVVFGAPVQAFSLNPVMKKYMQNLPRMEGKKVAILVTKQLPILWLGGTGAVAFMKRNVNHGAPGCSGQKSSSGLNRAGNKRSRKP